MRDTQLSDSMLARADADGLPVNHTVRLAANEFKIASNCYFLGQPRQISVQKFLGAYARARRVWAEYTGVDLI